MAETTDTANTSIDKRSDVDNKPLLSKFWLGEIAAAKKRDEKWWKRADKVIARYRDERDMDRFEGSDRRVNILWSNTETLKSALFQGVGNPDVRRRFPKKGEDDRAARQAALVLERGLSYCSDSYDSDSQIECIIEDNLLPGRGTGWLVYEANVYEGEEEGGEGGDEQPDGEEAGPEVTYQSVRIDHVYFRDFLTSAGRKWSDVWWCARGHDYSRDELRKYWPTHADKIPLNKSVSGFEDVQRKGAKEQQDTFKRARVWEIWDKSKRERVYVAEEYKAILGVTPDPYRLKDFFPTVEPLYGVKTTSTLEPIPEYTLYQDQAEELDVVQTRLCRITDAMKRRGIYDGTIEGPDNQLSQLAYAGDNQFVPYKNFAALMEKGGLKNIFQTEDLAPFVAVLQVLSEREQALLQKIYEITGISDILRGASNPNETATAQRIKGQFGSLRLQKRQKRIQTYIRDFYRLKAEIIAEHFTRDQLQEMTGIDLPLKAEQLAAQQQLEQYQKAEAMAKAQAQAGQGAVAAPPPINPKVMQKLIEVAKGPTWEEIASILRSDDRRGYKVDIETEATNAIDSEEEKAQRIEFLTAMGTMLQNSLPMIAQAPPPVAAALITLLKENAMFAAAAFKAGRTMEEAYDDAFTKMEDAAKAQANQPPKPTPEEQKLQADMQSKQLELQFRAKEAEQSHQLEQQKFAHESQLKERELQHSMQLEQMKAQNEAQIAQQKMAQEAELARYQAEQDMQFKQQEFAFTSQVKQREMEMASLNAERSHELETHKLNHAAETEGRKFNLEHAKFQHQGSMDQAKFQQEAAAQDMAGSLQAEIKQAQEVIAQLQQQLEQANALLQGQATAAKKGKKLVRGPDGRATHVETAHGRFAVERGPDGRAVGLSEMPMAA